MNGFTKFLRANQTDAERLLWKYLRNRQVDHHKFRRQVPLGDYVADFVFFGASLIVEVDGGQHSIQFEADETRTKWLETRGFTVLRFWNNDVLGNTEAVLDKIREHLITPSPLPLPQGERELK